MTTPVITEQPSADQPFAELGLTTGEYQRICEILERRPSLTELAMYAVMWSEHCSYKSSKVHLRKFGEQKSDSVLVGMGENAGVIDVGEGLAVTFKVESHNHPSYIEPYQGAATGVGGIVRDILTMGARPIAVMDPLRFGDPEHPDTKRVLEGVVAGVGGYGNCLGLPNIGGELVFDPTYQGNPLLNALCVGLLRHEQLQLAKATGPGNVVVLIGAKTGRDGIGGASVLASATFEEGKEAKRPSVQVGDPFTEKLLIECCLEIFGRGLVTGIQDLGAAGLTGGLSELSSHGGSGMLVELDTVPLREASMIPLEVLTSESQERMLAIVEPGNVDEVLAMCRKWGALATAIGVVTDSRGLVITWRGDVVVDVPPASLADDGPVYNRPMTRPADLDALQANTPDELARPETPDELRATLLQLVASPNLCSRRWVTEQYDRYVMGNTALGAPDDAGIVRISESGLGIALATDGNGRYTRLDPYAGAQLALLEAYRNVATTGARPLAVTDCLNFGSPENPEVMWQFAEAVRGLADACMAMGTPITGGNVSFYNQTGDQPINPTPVVGVLGVIDDVARRTPIAFSTEGETLVLLGETRAEFGGSEWAWEMHRHLGGVPPTVDFEAEKQLAEILIAASRDGMVSAAHDLSDGGLAQALVESCLHGGHGARVVMPAGADPFVWLFSESGARAVVALPRPEEPRFMEMCAARGFPATRIGVVDGNSLALQGLFDVPLAELSEAWEGTLPRLFG